MLNTFFSIELVPNPQKDISRLDDVPKRISELAARLVRAETSSFSVIPAGFTYLGQMISHDIVPPTIPKGRHRAVRPFLQLDSVYGERTARYFDRQGIFTPGSDPWDLRRDDNGKALIPEPRNDENVIIAQLHLLWQRLHNQLIGHKFASSGEEARSIVVQLFQLVVIEDYLERILDPRVFDAYFLRGERHLGLGRSAIPAEFSHAAFRFGHSMVRHKYKLNAGERASLAKLFRSGEKIPRNFRIDWRLFFPGDTDRTQKSLRINTRIVPLMGRIPGQNGNKNISINIAVANLLAGEAAGLEPGWKYVWRYLKAAPRHTKLSTKFALKPLGNSQMRALGWKVSELPMWPYFLLEAEVHEFGNRLGTLGSLFVAETLQSALRAASPSVLGSGPYRWRDICSRMGDFGDHLERRVYSGIDSDSRFPLLKMHHIVSLVESLEMSS